MLLVPYNQESSDIKKPIRVEELKNEYMKNDPPLVLVLAIAVTRMYYQIDVKRKK
jgi:hypothetical protein